MVGGEIALLYSCVRVFIYKGLIFTLILKKRLHTGNFALNLNVVVKLCIELGKIHLCLIFAAHSGAAGSEKM